MQRFDTDELISAWFGKSIPEIFTEIGEEQFRSAETELGSRTPPLPPSTTLPRRDIEVIAEYLLAKIIGRGPITREECFETLGERVRSCADYPAAQ